MNVFIYQERKSSRKVYPNSQKDIDVKGFSNLSWMMLAMGFRVQHLLNMCEALGLIPNIGKKNKRNKRISVKVARRLTITHKRKGQN